MLVSHPRFIADLPEQELKHLCALISPWRARKGSTVHAEGEEVKALYMLDAGRMQFEIHALDGRKLVVGFAGAGRAFGELEVVEGGPALASAVVNQAATGWRLSVPDFHAVLPHTPRFAALMLRTTARNARIHHLLYRHSLLMSPDERLALALLSMGRHGHTDATPDHELIQTTQDMLAQMLGTTRQCVSKHLRQWENAGWIAIQYGGITILDRQAISALLPQR
ncbi:MAG TPA: Crp/Fnr family transcriptional regulator [Aquabacterium sp.]|uniref:Crp/Fnr family transcriptional regulator n=1 Tax=Aquabacterium sp. TaxID=1872578 RepID=UPI002E33173C|nr:Crp/Fnr family transcriptional regulator [Aquabacterium sp.]HEX5356222.1 Crp/Fnr family transcriptional regulator [Aquabacterium sp.]